LLFSLSKDSGEVLCCDAAGDHFTISAFTHADHKSAKRKSSHQCLFALLGSLSKNAAHKILAKLTPVVAVAFYEARSMSRIDSVDPLEVGSEQSVKS